MLVVSKGFEALGIACVLLGLVQGINSSTLWVELYLSIIGIILFLIGWGIEKYLKRKRRTTNQ